MGLALILKETIASQFKDGAQSAVQLKERKMTVIMDYLGIFQTLSALSTLTALVMTTSTTGPGLLITTILKLAHAILHLRTGLMLMSAHQERFVVLLLVKVLVKISKLLVA